MTVYDQLVTSYSDTTPDMRAIANVISMIDPRDAPLVSRLGIASANEKFRIGVDSYKIELLEDEYAPLSSSLGATIATDTTVLTVADASVFHDGDEVLIDAEYVWVSAADTSGTTITVTRDIGGTNATHATDATVSIVGRARIEGDDAYFGPIVDISAPYNYTQIYEKGLKVSGTIQAIDQYGIQDAFGYQANKGVPELIRLLNLGAYHGQRLAGSSTTPRGMGGLLTFITDNTVNAGGAIAKADIDGVMEQCALDGGQPDLLVVNPSIANDIRTLIDSSSFVRVDQMNTQFGMKPITRVETQYGELDLLMDRWCPTSHAYLLDSSKVGFYTLRPFAWKRLGDTGDSKKGDLIGEFSLLVANDKAHGYVYGITT